MEMVSHPGSGVSSNNYSWEKGPVTGVKVAKDEVHDDHDEHRTATKSTRDDAENMRRMGRSQQLVRHFRLLSVASFVAIATAAWEIGLFEISPALTDGGRPALVYSVIWNFIGFGPIYLSMAEMASMAPIAGAQYHWVSEFAPESLQKILSYFTGYAQHSNRCPKVFGGANRAHTVGPRQWHGKQETHSVFSSSAHWFSPSSPSTTRLTHFLPGRRRSWSSVLSA